MRFAIDRLDKVKGEDGDQVYPIVDYKTRASHVKARNMDSIFTGEAEAANIFQLMLYANLMNRDRHTDYPVRLAIYEISSLRETGEVTPLLNTAPEGKRATYRRIATHKDINEEFLQYSDRILTEIFNEETPFVPVDDDDKCKFCSLSHLCGRSY